MIFFDEETHSTLVTEAVRGMMRSECDALVHALQHDELPRCVVDVSDGDVTRTPDAPNALTALRQQAFVSFDGMRRALVNASPDNVLDDEDDGMAHLMLVDAVCVAADSLALGLCGIGPLYHSDNEYSGIEPVTEHERQVGVVSEGIGRDTLRRLIPEGKAPSTLFEESTRVAHCVCERIDDALGTMTSVCDDWEDRRRSLPYVVREAWSVMLRFVSLESSLLTMSTDELRDECRKQSSLLRHVLDVDEHRYRSDGVSLRLMTCDDEVIGTMTVSGRDGSGAMRTEGVSLDGDMLVASLVRPVMTSDDEPLHIEAYGFRQSDITGPDVIDGVARYVTPSLDREAYLVYDSGMFHIDDMGSLDVDISVDDADASLRALVRKLMADDKEE